MEPIRNLLHLATENQVPAKRELIQQGNGNDAAVTNDEKRLLVAIAEQKISVSPVESLKEAIRYAMMKIGLRAANWPQEEEKNLLLNHIAENFGGHTTSEIRLAFDMAIAGKLDCEVNCYENFSCLYFSQVMNAYRRFATEAVRKAKAKEKPEQKIYTDEELDNATRGNCEAWFQRVMLGKPDAEIPAYVKPILVKDGYLNEDDDLIAFLQYEITNGRKNLYLKDDQHK